MTKQSKIDAVCVRLDPQTETILVGKRKTSLQHKAWCVLVELINAAPSIVSRDHLIKTVWRGNFDVGNKSLNHAMWSIRAALEDTPKEPAFIKTIAREGYRWVGPPPVLIECTNSKFLPLHIRESSRWAALFAVFCASMLLSNSSITQQSLSDRDASADRGFEIASITGKAYFSGRDLVFENLKGCQFVFQARATTTYGSPVFSADGSRLAVHANDQAGCKLLILEVEKGAVEIFNTCPSAESDQSSALKLI